MQKDHARVEKVDYLIVGGGLAGCSCGFLLSRMGARVLVLERASAQDKEKLCAGILDPRAERAFFDIYGQTMDEAGLAPVRIGALTVRYNGVALHRDMPSALHTPDKYVRPEPDARRSLASSLRLGGKEFAKKAIRSALGFGPDEDLAYRVVVRKRLDDYARDRLVGVGGQLLDRTTMRSLDMDKGVVTCVDLRTRKPFEVSFDKVVGADGATSTVRHELTGRQQRSVLALEASVPLMGSDTIGALAEGSSGYCWYVPRGDDATVGCVYHGSITARKSRERLQRFCDDIGVSLPDKLRGALIPKGDDVLLSIGERAFLLGDAAGLADAFTCGGIHYALLSAQGLAVSQGGGISYEHAMRPHVKAIRNNAKRTPAYYDVARALVWKIGSPTP